MKKIILIITSFLLAIVLVACKKTRLEPNKDSEVPTIDEWVAVWADEFNGDTLDGSKWNYEIDGGGGGNNELQYYTNRNAIVSDGTLKIVAKKEVFGTRRYTSSRITTKYKGDFLYGRFVMSAKMPTGRGTWPAFWMMPTMNKYGGWPNSGEIDIMEYVGYDRNVVHSSIHTKKYNHKIGTQQTFSKRISNAETEFHKYELIWEPGRITTFIDDVKYATFAYNSAFNQDVASKDAFPFDQTFFLILNLAIGGDWGGAQGVDDNIFPASFEIDYVRVYQKDYNYYDEYKPSAIENVKASARLNNSIYWNASSDDMGVEHYNVYLDGELYDTVLLPQIMLKGLVKNQEYKIQVEAIDFTGKKSEKSDVLTYVFK